MAKKANKTLLVHPDEFNDNWINRAKKLKIDNISLHPVGGYRATACLYDLLESLKTDDTKEKIDKAIKEGLNVGYQFHSAGYLMPRNYFNEHPEWFRLDENGSRVPDYNFCFSNEEAIEIVSNRALELSKLLYKNGDKFYFWLDDKKDITCHCEKCSQLSNSDKNMIVMNAIIKKLKTYNSNAKLSYLAYLDTMDVPSIKPLEGIFLEYAPIERDINIAAKNDKNTNKDNLLKLLSFFGTKDSEVLEYWFDNSKYSNWTKPPKKFIQNENVIKEDIKYYTSLGFENISSFACYLGDDYLSLYGEPDLTAITEVQNG